MVLEVLFGVQGTVFADGKTQQQVLHVGRWIILLTVNVYHGAGARLILLPDSIFQLRDERAWSRDLILSTCSGSGRGCAVAIVGTKPRSLATCQPERIKLTTLLRRLLTRAMFRHAFTESEACTPIESPCTLSTGLLACA